MGPGLRCRDPKIFYSVCAAEFVQPTPIDNSDVAIQISSSCRRHEKHHTSHVRGRPSALGRNEIHIDRPLYRWIASFRSSQCLDQGLSQLGHVQTRCQPIDADSVREQEIRHTFDKMCCRGFRQRVAAKGVRVPQVAGNAASDEDLTVSTRAIVCCIAC